ncbi:hypothetical protein SRABI106_04437 [Rahnella aquatilis]|nr:hypothetical protein SRABI106_04437 [Rahnella aquatilis]
MMKDNTALLKSEMNGKIYFSDMNHPQEMGRKVINVVISGNGHSVIHSSVSGGSMVFSALRTFQKRYPYTPETEL